MMKARGCECPFGKVLKVQNSMANVFRHVRAKSEDKKDPAKKQMLEAATERNKEINKASQISLQLHDRTDSELDIDLTSDAGNNNDDPEDAVDKNKQPNLRKFIPKKAHNYQPGEICWGTTCPRNARELNSVSEGDMIEILILKAQYRSLITYYRVAVIYLSQSA